MKYSNRFIGRTTEYATVGKTVCAPCFRRVFTLPKEGENIRLAICGLGIYHLFINGKDVTKGLISPYLSNPDHLVYCDEYDLTPYLTAGKNCIGVLLGSGALNAVDGHLWDEERLPWRSAPKLSIVVEVDGKRLFEGDELFKTHDSPWFYEDMRAGERYDARREETGWTLPDFDDSSWDNAILVPSPKGEMRSGKNVVPIRVVRERKVASVKRVKKDVFLYDFGYNTAGIFRMTLKNAMPGQQIVIRLGEWKTGGRLNQKNIKPLGNRPFQECRYICKGEEEEIFTPYFSYYGFRYIEVTGVTEKQATKELFVQCEGHTDLARTGDFRCSMAELNEIQQAVVNSDYSNFFHYPTDCPTREKNGWTGDAAVSCEQMLLNIDCADSLKEWLLSARKAQREDGALPTIVPLLVPTFDWGYSVGAVWDSFLTVICYRVYQYAGDREILEQNADAIAKYLEFLAKTRDERGLLVKGLSDWLQPGLDADKADSPNVVGLTFVGRETARMAKEIFAVLGQKDRGNRAKELEEELFAAIKKHLILGDTVLGDCLTSQALGVWYDAFEPETAEKAKQKLWQLCQKYDHDYSVGVVGNRIFPLAMSKCGYDDLLVKMMTDPDKPSYTSSLRRFPTALDEQFRYFEGSDEKGWFERPFGYRLARTSRKRPLLRLCMKTIGALFTLFCGKIGVHSLNHHFYGEPSHYFYTRVLGFRVNPDLSDADRVDVEPTYLKGLEFAEGFHKTPKGKISVRWERSGDKVVVKIDTEGEAYGFFRLPDGTKREIAKGEHTETVI